MSSDFGKRYKKALDLIWRDPPKAASRGARRRPEGELHPPPEADAVSRSMRPGDIRAAGTAETESAMASHSLPGVDVTLMVTPPVGDGLWTLQGRAWLQPRRKAQFRILLVQGENILAAEHIESGGRFRFEDLLTEGWHLELHLPDDETVILRSPSAGA